MTNSIALVLLAMIAALLLVDHFYLNWQIPLLVAREFVSIVEWLSFWR